MNLELGVSGRCEVSIALALWFERELRRLSGKCTNVAFVTNDSKGRSNDGNELERIRDDGMFNEKHRSAYEVDKPEGEYNNAGRKD